MPADPAVHFAAVLTPNRSLGRTGFCIIMAAASAVSFAAGIAFWAIGAWPVLGFFGIDLLLLYGAFKLSYRSGRLQETVQLFPDRLLIRRIDPAGQVDSFSFQPYWVRLTMPDPDAHDSQLRLASHGREICIGSFLSPAERASFGQALQAALGRLRAAAD